MAILFIIEKTVLNLVVTFIRTTKRAYCSLEGNTANSQICKILKILPYGQESSLVNLKLSQSQTLFLTKKDTNGHARKFKILA